MIHMGIFKTFEQCCEMLDGLIRNSLLCICLASLLSIAHAQQSSSTILDYRKEVFALAELPSVQVSAFHTQASAIEEAHKVLKSWQTEPTIIPWTRLQLALYVKHKMMPTRGARGLALVHVAMHDAYAVAAQKNLDTKIAVSMAAAQILGYLFVAEEGQFDRVARALQAEYALLQPALSVEVLNRSAILGFQIGRAVVAHADTDGAQKGWNGLRLQYYGEGRYFGPGTWEPTAPYFYYPPDEPFAPNWRPWVLKPTSEFRPTPPVYGSPKYTQDVEEVLSITAALTDDQRRIARFWVDGHGSVTPAGHWNQIAMTEVVSAKLDDLSVARLFAHMNIAMADTFIAVWDTKYHFWSARPVTSAKQLLGAELKPTLLTPPFPSYVSGHAGFSGAAARVLAAYIPLRAKALDGMAEEAANSRLLGGIHFKHDNDDGLVLGRKVADKVLLNLKN